MSPASAAPRVAAFFETRQELNALRRWAAQTGASPVWIALSPEAEFAATECGIEHSTIEDFYSFTSLSEKGLQRFEHAKEFCLEMDRRLSPVSKALQPPAFSTCFYFYFLKRLFDALLRQTYTLKHALLNLRPQSVVCFKVAAQKPTDDLTFSNDPLCSRVLPYLATSMGIDGITIPSPSRHPPTSSWPKRVRLALERVPEARLAMRWIDRFRPKATRIIPLHTLSAWSRTEGLLIVGDFWTDQEVLKQAERQGIHVITLAQVPGILEARGSQSDRMTGILQGSWNVLRNKDTFRSFFREEGLDLFPLAEPLLRHFVERMIPRHLRIQARLHSVLRKMEKVVILGSSTVTLNNATSFGAARQTGKPTVAHQHGAIGYHDFPMLEYTELQLSDHYFCYGEGVATHMNAFSNLARLPESKSAPKAIAVGSQDLARLRSQLRDPEVGPGVGTVSERRRVIYVVTSFTGNSTYFSNHMYPDLWYWRLQQRIIETCLCATDISLFVKLYPHGMAPSPVPAWLRTMKADNVTVFDQTNFAETLSLGDLYIIDYPSTILLQALTTRRKILAFFDPRYLRLDPHAVEMLRRRALVSVREEDFLRDIARELSKRDWSCPEPVDDDFLTAYGTSNNSLSPGDTLLRLMSRDPPSTLSCKESKNDVS